MKPGRCPSLTLQLFRKEFYGIVAFRMNHDQTAVLTRSRPVRAPGSPNMAIMGCIDIALVLGQHFERNRPADMRLGPRCNIGQAASRGDGRIAVSGAATPLEVSAIR